MCLGVNMETPGPNKDFTKVVFLSNLTIFPFLFVSSKLIMIHFVLCAHAYASILFFCLFLFRKCEFVL